MPLASGKSRSPGKNRGHGRSDQHPAQSGSAGREGTCPYGHRPTLGGAVGLDFITEILAPASLQWLPTIELDSLPPPWDVKSRNIPTIAQRSYWVDSL